MQFVEYIIQCVIDLASWIYSTGNACCITGGSFVITYYHYWNTVVVISEKFHYVALLLVSTDGFLLQQKLQAKGGIKVNEVLQGGALGLGITLPGRFDMDLIIYSEGNV